MSLIYEKIRESFIMSFLKKAETVYKKSLFYGYFAAPSKIDAKYLSSIFVKILNIPLSLINRVIERLIASAENSLIIKKIKKSRIYPLLKFEYILSLFIFLMLLAHHNLWNNLYGVAGSALLVVLTLFHRVIINRPVKAESFSFPLIIFLIAVTSAIFITPVFSQGLRIALFIFSAAGFYFSVKEGITDKKSLRLFLYTLTAALFIMSIYAVIQNFTGLETDAMLTDIANNKGMAGRVYSTVENPNNFAEIIVLIIPFIAALFFSERKKEIKAILAAAFFLCVVALLLTYSRGSYVSFAISAVVFIALYKPKWLIPLFFAGIIMIPFLPESILNRILSIGSTADTSNAYRVFLWEGVAKMIRYEGLYGVGLGPEAFAAAYTPYASIFALNAHHSHMLYLQVFIETGLVGGIGFFAFIISVIKKGFASLSLKDNEAKLITIAAISAFFGIAFSSATEYIWFYPRVMFVFFVVAGTINEKLGIRNEGKRLCRLN